MLTPTPVQLQITLRRNRLFSEGGAASVAAGSDISGCPHLMQIRARPAEPGNTGDNPDELPYQLLSYISCNSAHTRSASARYWTVYPLSPFLKQSRMATTLPPSHRVRASRTDGRAHETRTRCYDACDDRDRLLGDMVCGADSERYLDQYGEGERQRKRHHQDLGL